MRVDPGPLFCLTCERHHNVKVRELLRLNLGEMRGDTNSGSMATYHIHTVCNPATADHRAAFNVGGEPFFTARTSTYYIQILFALAEREIHGLSLHFCYITKTTGTEVQEYFDSPT
jgi:hypothetical protein